MVMVIIMMGTEVNKPHQISTLVIFFELEFHNDWLVVRGLGGMVKHLQHCFLIDIKLPLFTSSHFQISCAAELR